MLLIYSCAFSQSSMIQEYDNILSLIDRGRNKEAKAELEAFIGKYKDPKLVPSAMYQLVKLETNVGKSSDILNSIVAKYPNSTWASISQYKIGEINFLAKHYEIALRAFEIYLRKYPDGQWKNDALLNSAFCKMQLNKHNEALTMLETIKEKDIELNNDPKVFDAIGECQMILKKYKEAINTFDTITKRFPNYPFMSKTLFYKGLALEEQNKLKEAETVYDSLAKTFPSSSQAKVAQSRLNDCKKLNNIMYNVLSE